MSLEQLSQILECPRSKNSLVVKKGSLYSNKEELSYNNFSDIPWLFKQPDIQLFQWQEHLRNLLHFFHLQSQNLKFEIQKTSPTLKTKNRLELIQEGLHHNIKALSKLLSPLLSVGEVYRPDSYQLAMEKLPHTQHLNSYTHTLFRDWAWDENEINKFTALTLELFKQDSPKNLVVLGSGASRLSWDIHLQSNSQHTICVDINPLLFFAAKAILSGNSIELYEFPTAPLLMEHSAVKHRLKSGSSQPLDLKNFDFLFADAITLPFKSKSLQTVLTPWFIDIIPEDFSNFAKRLNRILTPGGSWINIGPLSYDNFKSQGYSQEEIFEILQASGFKIEVFKNLEMDYLVSPYSSQTRREKVLGFNVKKVKEAKQPPTFTYLPDWITSKDSPIPKSDATVESQLKHQVAYQLLNLINGKRTQKDIINIMKNSYNMTDELAEQTLVTFLIHYFENKL